MLGQVQFSWLLLNVDFTYSETLKILLVSNHMVWKFRKAPKFNIRKKKGWGGLELNGLPIHPWVPWLGNFLCLFNLLVNGNIIFSPPVVLLFCECLSKGHSSCNSKKSLLKHRYFVNVYICQNFENFRSRKHWFVLWNHLVAMLWWAHPISPHWVSGLKGHQGVVDLSRGNAYRMDKGYLLYQSPD